MAHLQKFTRSSAAHILGHCEREKSEHGEFLKYRTSSDIDTSKTHMNIDLYEHDGRSAHQRLSNRLKEVHVLQRKDVNVLCDWVVTLPSELLHRSRESIKAFFESTKEFLDSRYGKENNVSCNVHMDEATPHLHYCFVPVKYDDKKEKYKVSAKEVVNRSDLNSFHVDLEDHLHQQIGLPKGLIHSGITEQQGGNKSIHELKSELSSLEKKVREKKTELQNLSEAEKERYQSAPFYVPEGKKTPIGRILSENEWDSVKTSVESLKSENRALYTDKIKLTNENRSLAIELRDSKKEIARLVKRNSDLKHKASVGREEELVARVRELELLNENSVYEIAAEIDTRKLLEEAIMSTFNLEKEDLQELIECERNLRNEQPGFYRQPLAEQRYKSHRKQKEKGFEMEL